MKKFKKAIPMALALVALASCGGGGETSQTGDKWWTTTGELKRDDKGNIIFDEVVISFTHVVCGHDQVGFENMIKKFNSQYNHKIKIDYETKDQLTIDSNVKSRIVNNNNPPDLVMQHQKSHRNFEVNKLIQPVDECFEAAGIPLAKTDFIDKFASYSGLGYKDGSRIFDYPVDAQSMVGYYNKKLLAQLGEEVPTTRDDLIRICKRAKTELQIDTPLGTTGESTFFEFYGLTTALDQNGFEFYKNDDYKVNWTSNENVAAFSRAIHSLYDLEHTEKIYKYDSANIFADFAANDKVLFFFDLPFNASTAFETYLDSHKDVTDIEEVKRDCIGGFSLGGMYSMNGAPTEKSSHLFGDSHAFMVSKTVTDITKKAAIATFINWFTSQGDIGAEWAELGHAAGVNAVRNSNEYKNSEYVKNYTEKWYPDLNNFDTPDITPYYSIVFNGSQGLYNVFVNCLRNGTVSSTQIKDALSNAQRWVNGTIESLD